MAILQCTISHFATEGQGNLFTHSFLLSSKPHVDYSLCAGGQYILVICDLKFDYYIISMYTSGVWAKEINFTFKVLLENPIDSCIWCLAIENGQISGDIDYLF